ncbi:MAG TPA: SurA N-terminal domain-containing protein [Elusimicrobiota bacterium]|nr:SurA N-terminal domain-containing protein [Elusimicrobiota bacterium]
MMKWLRKHRYTIFLITVGGFLVGSFMGFGSYFFTQSPYDAAIVVNGDKIPYKRYVTRYHQYLNQRRDNNEPLNEENIKRIKQETLQDLVREAVFLQEADKYGLTVTDNEVAAYIQRSPAFQRDGQFDQGAYLQVLTQVLRIPADEFEDDRRREIKIQKLQALMASAVKVSNIEFNWQYQKRMALGNAEEKKTAKDKPNEFREQLRQEQVSHVFQEWLSQINSQLKVKVYLDKWEGRGEG